MPQRTIEPQTTWGKARSQVLTSADSTQTSLERWWKEEPALPAGSWVMAAQQTQGKGREGRSWIMADGGLALSVLLRPPAQQGILTWIPAVAGLALVRTLRQFGISDLRLKWPNDLLTGARKLAGIICQLWSFDAASDSAVVAVGLGLNIQGDRDWFARQGLGAATSLSAENFPTPEANKVAEKVLIWLNVLTEQLQQSGASALWAEYTDLLGDTQRSISVRDAAGQTITGRVEGVGNDGQLLVRNQRGILTPIVAGIVEWDLHELIDD